MDVGDGAVVLCSLGGVARFIQALALNSASVYLLVLFRFSPSLVSPFALFSSFCHIRARPW